MSIICSICSDVFGEHYKTVFTQCGHVFHSHCIKKWLKRSNTCPQCRQEITDGMLHKLFFTYSNQERDFVSLEDRNINLEYKILLKQSDIQYYKKKNETLEKQNASLRNEVRKVEGEISEKNSAIHALREQISYFKERSVDYENTKEKVERLKKELEELKNIQRLLKEPTTSVHRLIGDSRNPDILIRYVSIMKGELLAHVRKIKQLRHKIARLQKKLDVTSQSESFVVSEVLKETQEEISDIVDNSNDDKTDEVTLNRHATDEYYNEQFLSARPPKKRIAHKSNENNTHLPIIQDNSQLNDIDNEIPMASKKLKMSHGEVSQKSDDNFENSAECSYFDQINDTNSKLRRRRLSSKNGKDKFKKMRNASGDVIDLT